MATINNNAYTYNSSDDNLGKTLSFDGTPSDWKEWRNRFLSRARCRGYYDVLTTNIDTTNFDATQLRNHTALCDAAMNALINCTTGTPHTIVTNCGLNPYLAWSGLCNTYRPTNIHAEMVLQQELLHCSYSKFLNLYTWFAEVERLYADRYDRYNVAYTDTDIIKHLMNNLPPAASGVLSTIRAGLINPVPLPLSTVKELIIAHFKDMENSGNSSQSVAPTTIFPDLPPSHICHRASFHSTTPHEYAFRTHTYLSTQSSGVIRHIQGAMPQMWRIRT